MKSEFSASWKASKQPRKQRKYSANAPLHIKGRSLSANLAKPLREKHGLRSFRLRKGDKVKILRGQFKGKEGKIEDVDVKKLRVFVSKIEISKKDGSKARVPLRPSNLQILEFDRSDKKRVARLEKVKSNG